MKNKKIEIIKVACIVALLTFCMLLCGEAILRQDLLSVFKWIKLNPVGFVMNYMVLFGLFMALACSLNRISISFLVVSLIYITVCVISFYKYQLSGEYLIPSDLIMVGEAASISKDMNITLERHVVKGVLFSIFLIVVAFQLDIFHLHKPHRFALGVFFSLLFITVAGTGARVMNNNSENQMTETDEMSRINKQYSENGFLIGFSQEIDEMIVREPEGYDEEKAQSILKRYEDTSDAKMEVKPNVIMIMSESLFDLNRLEGVKFSRNPMENFDQVRKSFGGGNIITGVYGGKTSQTEYEVLTGNSVDFTGTQNIAYLRFVEPGIEAIPKLLKKEGYSTYAIHSYEGDFYSRNQVYEDMDIDYFWDMDSFESPELIRGYISDHDTFSKIIEAYETKEDGPMFAHVVTMQNHMPYEVSYDGEGISVTSKGLNTKNKQLLETYANGVAASDKALGELIDYFSQVLEPTIIVMYGDHLPALGERYDVYLNSKYIRGTFDQKDCFSLYQTPVMVWNNYGLPQKDFGYIDATYLGAQILDYIGYKGDAYMKMLVEASKALPAYNETFIIDKNQNIRDGRNLNQEEAKWLEELRYVQYYRLFGGDKWP